MKALIENVEHLHPKGVSERYMIGEEFFEIGVDVDGNSGYTTITVEGLDDETIDHVVTYLSYLTDLSKGLRLSRYWLVVELAKKRGTDAEYQLAVTKRDAVEKEIFPYMTQEART